MIPKFHKSPIKFRYIVASNNCSFKPLSNAIGKALQNVRKDRKYHCNKLEKYDGINRFWVIDSSGPILDCIKQLNATKSAKTVTTYDFSSLYTSLSHEEILDSLRKLIKEVLVFFL